MEVSGLSILSNLALKNELSSSQNSALSLPNFNLPDADTLIESKKLAIRADIDNIKTEIGSIEHKWKNKLDQLPDQDKLDEYKARIKRLKGKGDLFEKLAAAKDLQNIYREIRKGVKQIKNLQGDFKQDREQLKNQIAAARKLPQKYSRELVQSLGMDSSQLSNLASDAFAGNLKGTLESLLSGIEIPGSNTESSPLPYDIVIHNAVIEGPIFEQISGLALTAKLSDLSYPFEKAEKAISINIEGRINDREGLQLLSTIDHRDGIDGKFSITASSLELQGIALSDHPDISIALGKALLNMSGELSLEDEEISGTLIQSFSDSTFITELSPGAPKAAKVIAGVLTAASDFGLTLNFSGTLSEPELSFKTSKLDKLISKAVINQVGKEVQRLQSDTSHMLTQQLDPQISSLFSQVEGFNSIGRTLEEQKKDWRKLSK